MLTQRKTTGSELVSYATGPAVSTVYRSLFLLGVTAIATWGSVEGGGDFGYVVASIAFVISVRGLSERVRADNSGLWFRNQFRAYRATWPDVEQLKYDVSPMLHSLSGLGRQRHRVVVEFHGSRRFIPIEATQTLRGGPLPEDIVGLAPTRSHLAAFESFRNRLGQLHQ